MPTYEIAGVPIDFPFEAYEVQLVYMEKVVLALERGEHALLESPTGTGKTLCLLCAALGWRKHQVEKMKATVFPSNRVAGQQAHAPIQLDNRKLPRIIYTSRTHSQLKQVVKQLRMTSYRPIVCVIGSREQMCVHPDVSKKHGVDQIATCQAVVASKECRFNNELERRKNPGRSKRGQTAGITHPDQYLEETSRILPDIEDFVTHAQTEGVCPFHWARELKDSVDVLLMPYNFLADRAMREGIRLKVDGDVLIFDEAHNVERVFAEASSFEMNALDFAGIARDIDAAIRHQRDATTLNDDALSIVPGDGDRQEVESSGLVGNLLHVKNAVLDLEALLYELSLTQPRRGGDPRYSGDGHAMRGLLDKAKITNESLPFFLTTCSSAIKSRMESTSYAIGGSSAHYLRKFAECLQIVFDGDLNPSEFTVCVMESADSSTVSGDVASSRKASASSNHREAPARVLGYWCQNPGVAMRALVKTGVRSVVLTSGTLSPLSSFALELGIPFAHQLENPHVISPRQIMVGVLPKGPSGVELTSTYQHRESDAYKCELGSTLANVARLVPQGVLVFFSSYAALKSAYERWARSGADGSPSILQRLMKHKHVIMEPRSASDVATAIAAFKEHVAASERTGAGGAILLAVCRGRLSEGVDFSDSACRAVIIAGLPLPPMYDAKVQLKREYLERCARQSDGTRARLGGDEWYDQQAMRAINQAIGRVIRHVADYGAVLLCESRFRRPRYISSLSVWLRPHVRQFEQFGQASVALPRFYRAAAEDGEAKRREQLARAPAVIVPPPRPIRSTTQNCAERPYLPPATMLPAAPPPSLLKVLEAAKGTAKDDPQEKDTQLFLPNPPRGASAGQCTALAAHEQVSAQLPVGMANGTPTKKPRVGIEDGIRATTAPAEHSRESASAASTDLGPQGTLSDGSAPKARELLAMAQTVMSKSEYDEYIQMLRYVRELKRAGADVAEGGIASVKTQAAALFVRGKHREVASKTLRFIPPEFRSELQCAFMPTPPRPIESSLGALQAKMRKHKGVAEQDTCLAGAKDFMQKCQAAFCDADEFAAFKEEMSKLLLELKRAGAPRDACCLSSRANTTSSAWAGEVKDILLQINGVFKDRRLSQSLLREFGRFIPIAHKELWTAIIEGKPTSLA